MKRVRERLAAEMRALRGGNALAVVTKLNPIIKGSPGVLQPVA
jgi:RNA-directed DNA polymerase